MSNKARIGLIAVAIAVAVAAFVIAKDGDDEGGTAGVTPTTKTTAAGRIETATTPVVPPPTVITLRDHSVVGGQKTLTAVKGERVRFTVATDTDDQIHLHGYDVEKEAKPGAPAKFDFKANIEGTFEIESHTAEHAGKEPVIAKLTVNPS
jgi:hypothetical protein